jgi:hypothetical protein
MRVCYLDGHEARLCCYLVIQKTYHAHYRYFTCICDLFTDSPSYIQSNHRSSIIIVNLNVAIHESHDTVNRG